MVIQGPAKTGVEDRPAGRPGHKTTVTRCQAAATDAHTHRTTPFWLKQRDIAGRTHQAERAKAYEVDANQLVCDSSAQRLALVLRQRVPQLDVMNSRMANRWPVKIPPVRRVHADESDADSIGAKWAQRQEGKTMAPISPCCGVGGHAPVSLGSRRVQS